MQFNTNQQQAVNHGRGAMLVLAGPGSGKTAVITGRVRKLIERDKVPPEKILVITFSRAAAVEMKTRYETATGEQYTSVSFGTFHAVFFKILRCDCQYRYSNIISDEDRLRVIRDLVVKYNMPADNMAEFVEHLSATISSAKSEGQPIEKFKTDVCKREDFLAVFTGYQEYLRSEGKIDFDDMMTLCLDLFLKRPDVLRKWQDTYEYILIDEFQDINSLQYKLVRMIAAPENNVFAVGDDDQSVYGFRGAHPKLMFQFEKDFKGCKRVVLNVNYRCRTEIIERASKLIGHNSERFTKKIESNKGRGGQFEYMCFETLEDEYEFIADYAREWLEKGLDPEKVAVLYRMNHQARGLYRALTVRNIPCKLREHIPCVFDHWISEDIQGYIRLATGACTRAGLLHIINRPKRYVTRDSIMACMEEKKKYGPEIITQLIAENSDKPYVTEKLTKLRLQLNLLAKLDALGSVKFVRKAMGYDTFLKEYGDGHGVPETELMEIVGELEESARGFDILEDWAEAMAEVKRHLKEADKTPGVELMTFHSAKGLEFDTVFIIDALEGFAPSKRAQSSAEFEEERRAFYVAMTRAKEELYVFSSKERLGREFPVSRFVKEMGIEMKTGK